MAGGSVKHPPAASLKKGTCGPRMAQGDYRTLPENVETDQEGLRMEMVYTQ